MGAGLVLDLNYFLRDLSLVGQQIIIRCGKRVTWFLSKCLWCFLSSVVYMLFILLSAAVFVLLSKGNLSMSYTPKIMHMVFGEFNELNLSVPETIIVGILLPFLTISTIHMLQLVLCVFISPVTSFMICMGILVLSIYFPVPWIIGNGAMIVRSIFFENGCISAQITLTVVCAELFFCVCLGCWGFKKSDILPQDE